MSEIFYIGQDGQKHNLVETTNLLVVRTKNSLVPTEVVNSIEIQGSKTIAEVLDYYPEASVYVYKLNISSISERDYIKQEINNLRHPDIDFVGSVFKRSDNGVYQIYTGNLFLKFRRGTTRKHIEKLFNKYGLVKKSDLKFAVNSFFTEFENPIGRSIFEKSVEILMEDSVEICQPELVVSRKIFAAEVKPNVELLYDEWAAKMIRLKEAWSFTKGRGVKICIIDDGIELSHPSFINEHRSILTKDMFFDDDTPATHKDDSEKHGTACASIAAGNDANILGVAPEADLLVVRSKGLGSVYEAEAIYWAVRNKADIISCSWGPADGNLLSQQDDFISHPLPDHTRLALEYAVSHGRGGKGCLIFFAAGNGREPIEFDGYASNSNVMAIGAVNKLGKRSYYSDHGKELFCCFPSSEVIIENHRNILTIYGLPTLDRMAELGYSSDDYFSSFGGTSASSPGMAGVAALLLSINGSLDLNQCKQLLQESCYYPDSIDKELKPKELGHGIIDAHVLVQKAQNYSNILNEFPMTTQNKKLAIHVAVDELNQSIFKGDYPTLYGCKKDLALFKSLTDDKYEQIVLEDKNAIRTNVLSALEKAVERLREGDELVFTFSGHGGTYNDNGSDEIDGKDECLVLHDGLWMDDEIYDLHRRFADGVKIFWYTDSCHSGTSTRGIGLERSLIAKRANTEFRSMKPVKYRQIEHAVLKNVYEQNRKEYDRILRNLPKKQKNDIEYKASIIHFAACQDDQFAEEIDGYGLFTSTLFNVIKGKKDLSFQKVFDLVNAKMKAEQRPKLNEFGKKAASFLNNPFIGFVIDSSELVNNKEDERLPYSNILSSNQLVTSHKGVIPGQAKRRSGSKLSISGLQLDAGQNIWDAAYEHAVKSGDDLFVEPYLSSNIYAFEDHQLDDDDGGYLGTYPYPNGKNGFGPLWHLDDEHSQLKKAREEVLGDELLQDKNIYDLKEYPLIVHIDTGILAAGKMQPVNLDLKKSKEFANPTDEDKINLVEQQGHGNATLAILAGGRMIIEGNTLVSSTEYFGGFPFARVVTLKISETVAILDTQSFADALDYAVEVLKADVVTMSMAGIPSKRMAEAVNKAYENGVVVVTAAGNTWSRGIKKILPDKIMYPARFDRVIAVTGATLYHTPYQNEINEKWERAAGGTYMQSCFGPADAMRTAIAAYTPNLLWFSLEKEPYFQKSGGGTSSATPQVAAAAALYIWKYRGENVIKKRDWKRTEIVRQALFRSADTMHNGTYGALYEVQGKHYDQYFGNGILKAWKALQIDPKTIGNVNQEKEASLGRFQFDNIIGSILGLRGKSQNRHLKEMMALEFEQLLYTDPELFSYIGNDGLTREMKEKIYQSPFASATLKSALKSHLALIPNEQRGLVSVPSLARKFKVGEQLNNLMTIQVNNVASSIKQIDPCHEVNAMASYEVVLNLDETRGQGSVSINIDTDLEEDAQILIVAQDEQGKDQYIWMAKSEYEMEDASTRSSFRTKINDNHSATLFLENKRGIFSGLKKLIVNIVRALNDKPASALVGLIKASFEFGQVTWKEVEKTKRKDEMIKAKDTVLLLIHGTFSSVEASFHDLLHNVDFQRKAVTYTHVLGFNHSTIKSGIDTNCDDLTKLLNDLNVNFDNCTVISTSRGGLIARKVFGTSKAKLILSACPNEGTPMADKKQIVTLANRITKLSYGLAGSSLVPGVIAHCIELMAKGIWDMPGLEDMAPDSDFIRTLPPWSGKEWLIGVNHNADGIKSVVDIANDNLVFGNELNDMVVPLASAVPDLSHMAFKIENSASTHHVNYFTNKDILNYVISIM